MNSSQIYNTNRHVLRLIKTTRPIGIMTGIYASSSIHIPNNYKPLFKESIIERLKVTISNQYLTHLSQSLTILLLVLLIFNDYKKIKFIQHAVPALCSIQFLVTFMYWLFFSINPMYIWGRKLIESGWLPYPPADICAHGLPHFILFINGIIVAKRRSNVVFVIIITFYVFYIVMINALFLRTGRWPYPFLKMAGPVGRGILYLTGGAVCCLHYEVFCLCLRKIKRGVK